MLVIRALIIESPNLINFNNTKTRDYTSINNILIFHFIMSTEFLKMKQKIYRLHTLLSPNFHS